MEFTAQHNKNVMYATLKSPGKRLIAVNLGLQQNTDPGSTDPLLTPPPSDPL